MPRDFVTFGCAMKGWGMSDEKRATHPDTFERLIMDPNVPKNEMEWWCHKEIMRLRAMIAADCNLMVEWSKKVTQAKDMADQLTAERDGLIQSLEDMRLVNREKEDHLVVITGYLAESNQRIAEWHRLYTTLTQGVLRILDDYKDEWCFAPASELQCRSRFVRRLTDLLESMGPSDDTNPWGNHEDAEETDCQKPAEK